MQNLMNGDRARTVKTHHDAQTRMNRPPPHVHGKEGVDGSSPSEGLKKPANQRFLLSVLNRVQEGATNSAGSADLQAFLTARASRTVRCATSRSHPGRTALSSGFGVPDPDAGLAAGDCSEASATPLVRLRKAHPFRLSRLALGISSALLLRSYQSAWTAVPLCSVATVPLALHATAADMSGQFSAASCQCLAMPAGDS